MIEIGIYKINKDFGYKKILNEVSFEVLTGDRIGMVGRNGSGKSTLFKMIMRDEKPDSGTINIRRNASIGYLEQIPTLCEFDVNVNDILMESFKDIHEIEQKMRDLERKMENETDSSKLQQLLNTYSSIQNEFITLGGYEIEEKLSRVINGFKLHELMERPFNVLSGGQKTIVNLAKLILKEPDILLLDEPTNHLDINMIEWLESYLCKYPGTVVIISHDRYFLDKVSTKTLLLDSGESALFHGNYSFSLKEKEKLLLQEFEQYKNQQKKIDAIKAAIKRYRDWGNQGDNEKFFKKAKELEKRLEKMDILDKPQMEKPKIPISFSGDRLGDDALIVEDFGISFGDHKLFESLEFIIYYKEKVSLIGDNGTGKSSLIKAILGDIYDYKGKIKLSPSAKIGYIPQEIRFEDESNNVLDAFRKEYPCSEGEARNILAKYYFYKDHVFKKVNMLSGGEKVLLKLAILIKHEVNFLILDEPTNHIDIETREILEQALMDYSGTLLFVSHDRYFIDKIADKILKIQDGKMVQC